MMVLQLTLTVLNYSARLKYTITWSIMVNSTRETGHRLKTRSIISKKVYRRPTRLEFFKSVETRETDQKSIDWLEI
jgi:hypothetical protein